MSKLRIFIEGEELDTLESVSVPITKQFEELADPTIICNDYSKTIVVPLSAHNNAIFGHAYRPDRVIATAANVPLVGVYFDPYKRLTCRVQWGDDVILQGYAKMLKVTHDGYEVTINGELGGVFQTAKKITFDATEFEGEEKTAYWIDGSKYVNANLDRSLVVASWESMPGARSADLHEVGESGYNVTDIIGFTPNNAYTDNFNHKSYELNGVETTFQSVLENIKFEEKALISAETAVGDGLKPRDIGEFRAVNQIPHIYWDKFCQIFAKQLQVASGYTLNLTHLVDNRPLVLRLKQQEQEVASLQSNLYTFSSATATYSPSSNFSANKTRQFSISVTSESVKVAEGNTFNLNGNGGLLKVTLPTLLRVSGSSVAPSRLYADNAIVLTISAIKSSGGGVTNTIYIVGEGSEVAVPDGAVKVVAPDLTANGEDYDSTCSVESYFSLTDGIYRLECSWHFLRSTYPFVNQKSSDTPLIYTTFGTAPFADQTLEVVGSKSLHTITLNDLWDNDVKPFDVILRYCKAHRLRFVADTTNKILNVQRFATSASDFTIKDMTERVDVTDGFSVEPIAFSSHFVLFDTEPAETKIAEDYEATYGLKYGEKRIATAYEFDTSTKSLFEENSKVDIVATPNVNSWDNLFNARRVIYTIPAEVFLDTCDEEGKYVDNFGSMYYVVSASFDTTSNLRRVMVTDASYNQEYNQSYYYSQDTGGGNYKTYVTTYLQPNHVNGDLCELYTIPKDNYTYLANYFTAKKDIYSRFWQSYINERYNIQNKVVTCKVRLTPMEFAAFDFTQLWRIGGVLYMVNKISDYDVTSDGLTEVELVTIQDINGYL